MGQSILERRRAPATGGARVVGQDELARAAGGEDVELDHVHAGRERRVERGERVAGRDQARTLVPDPADRRHRWHPGHQNVRRLSSPWPRTRTRAPQRGHGRPARP